MAKANVMIDNQKTRVTEWTFEVGDETGQHIHEYDYVVVPMLDGELKIINHDGVETISKLKAFANQSAVDLGSSDFKCIWLILYGIIFLHL